jgi:hypothetical protein
LLQELRIGNVSPEGAVQIATASKRQFNTTDGIKPTVMYCKKVDVEKENNAELDKLPGMKIPSEAKNKGVSESEDKAAIAPHWLFLKVEYGLHHSSRLVFPSLMVFVHMTVRRLCSSAMFIWRKGCVMVAGGWFVDLTSTESHG